MKFNAGGLFYFVLLGSLLVHSGLPSGVSDFVDSTRGVQLWADVCWTPVSDSPLFVCSIPLRFPLCLLPEANRPEANSRFPPLFIHFTQSCVQFSGVRAEGAILSLSRIRSVSVRKVAVLVTLVTLKSMLSTQTRTTSPRAMVAQSRNCRLRLSGSASPSCRLG